MQLDRYCTSGLEAVNQAAIRIRSGWEDLIVAGGVGSMSRVPMGSNGGAWLCDPEVYLQTLAVPHGIGADLLATLDDRGREDLDAFGVESQRRAAPAGAAGGFDHSVVPVRDFNGLAILAQDEFIKPSTTTGTFAQLKPAFAALAQLGWDDLCLRKYPHVERIRHLHTPGNSSGIVDGASAMLIGSEQAGKQAGRQARISASARGAGW